MSNGWKPDSPFLAADVIIELLDRPGRPIVLIQRKNPPPGYAIPGGFVDNGEEVSRAARREAKEETSLEVTLKALLGIYSDPGRDARWHTASAVYVAEAHGEPVAADDAKAILVVDPATPPPLAFDHAQILKDYLYFREHGTPPPLREV